MNRRLKHGLGQEAVDARLHGDVSELRLAVRRATADHRLLVTLLLGEVLTDSFCRCGPVTLWHAEVHQDQLVHGLG